MDRTKVVPQKGGGRNGWFHLGSAFFPSSCSVITFLTAAAWDLDNAELFWAFWFCFVYFAFWRYVLRSAQMRRTHILQYIYVICSTRSCHRLDQPWPWPRSLSLALFHFLSPHPAPAFHFHKEHSYRHTSGMLFIVSRSDQNRAEPEQPT